MNYIYQDNIVQFIQL